MPSETEEKSMALTRDEVLHVANLARLSLVPEEIELFTRQLNDILAYVEKLQELDTDRGGTPGPRDPGLQRL